MTAIDAVILRPRVRVVSPMRTRVKLRHDAVGLGTDGEKERPPLVGPERDLDAVRVVDDAEPSYR